MGLQMSQHRSPRQAPTSWLSKSAVGTIERYADAFIRPGRNRHEL